MKFVSRLLSFALLAGAALFYSSCGGDGGETKSEEQTQLEGLSKTWSLTSADLGGDPRTTDFPNLKLTLSGAFAAGGTYNYSFTGTTPTPSPWPRSGKWKFGSTISTQIIRDPATDAFPMEYSLSGNTLTIEFTCTACDYDGGSRVSSANGDWTFVFTGS